MNNSSRGTSSAMESMYKTSVEIESLAAGTAHYRSPGLHVHCNGETHHGLATGRCCSTPDVAARVWLEFS